jgi:hypothetical protein
MALIQSILILSVFITLLTLGNGSDAYYSERAGAAVLLGLGVGAWFCQLYGWLIGSLAAYCSVSAVWGVFYRHNKFHALSMKHSALDQTIEHGIASGALTTLMCWVGVNAVPARIIRQGLIGFGLASCIHYWFTRHYWSPQGFMMTWTLASVYLALCVPLMSSLWVIVVFVLTILGSGGATGLATLVCVGLGYAIYHGYAKYAVSAVIAGTSLAVYFMNGNLDDKGRFMAWRGVYDWWSTVDHQWLGIGAGTTYGFVPMVQYATKMEGLRNFYMHNEYLQVLFELGYIGAALVILVSAWGLIRARRCPHQLAFMLGLIPACLTMFPFRHETLMILVVFQLHQIFIDTRITR